MAQSRTDTIADGDLFVVWKTEDGDFRQAPMSVVLDYLNANLTFPSVEWVTQYAAPAASGFTVAMTSDALSRHLILSPLAGYAAGTITLPLASGCVDGQQVLVTTTQAVTALTIGANGAASVAGAPTSLTADAFFTLKYDLPTLTWRRVA